MANSTFIALPPWMLTNGTSIFADAISRVLGTGWTWASVAAATATLLTIHRFVSTLILHPLASIPGPWYAAVSNVWLTSQVLRLQQCKSVQDLFDKYGPVVRVGPNKVVFCDLDSMKMIYNVHKFDKGLYYKSLKTNDNDHAMTTLEHTPYIIRRKAYAPHFLPSNLARFQPEIREFVIEVVDAARRIGGKQPIDTLQLFRQLMVDIVSVTSYGYHIGAVAQWDIGVEHYVSAAVSDFPKRSIIRSALPAWLWYLVRRIPHPRVRQFCEADIIIRDFIAARIGEIRAREGSFDPSSSHGDAGVDLTREFNVSDFSEDVCGEAAGKPRIPMVERLLQYKYPGNVQMPDSDILSESIGHTIAGVDTSSMSLSYFLWEGTRQPDILRKLQLEVDDAMPDSHVLPDLHVVLRLPYVNAFVKEGLRVYGAVPTLLERVVPATTTAKDGSTSDGFELLGYGLPSGTVVATQAWSQHRDPSIFPSPYEFNPDRWLTASPEQLTQMERASMAFGSGSRICGGHNLANVVMRMVVCAIVRNFQVTAPAWTNEKSMDVKDSFVIFPAGLKCDLILTPRQL